MHKEAGVY